eukprot:CAMPEP_0183320912 /NCGR_PEP_ID=MMETSP0160_2-20130417/67545_1 /TAXON_ID=2839 ORGANISM="Odontella Sinensis, Strain Grunow 1884" /NCGR_SAMPLE_ID=MMETSP0160_2 /ASSEMBLY_ACC=CAM_ASM_000250 /LENGTH=333 /DNA_ID=CAMNT_0025487713 /DNA_START=262 /DNA_END=1260 /DNA_ORIENTATION=-
MDPDYSWHNRQTGVIQGRWQTGIGFWQHYKPEDLMDKGPPKAYTSGYMRKHLKQISDEQFDLWSVYEKSAQGKFLDGMMKERECDGHMEHSYSFRQVPFRITDLSTFGIPNLVTTWDATIRAFIVQPSACTFSGKLWIPSIEEQQAVEENAVAFQTYELWLAEDYKGQKEGRKVGVFLSYNGVTGKLEQAQQMHEIATDITEDPGLPIDFEACKKVHPVITSSPKDVSSASATVSGRILHLNNGPQGAEHACEFANQPLCYDFGINDSDSSAYLKLELDNGVKLIVPKAFDASLKGKLLLQMKCPRLDGSMHRITVLGDREQHGFHTLCYEEW